MTTQKSNTSPSFLSASSTLWVTFIRLLLIFLPRLLEVYDENNRKSSFVTTQWLYSPAFLSVLVRPHETLSHFQEAQAVQELSTGKTIGEIYSANHSIRIPPLVFAALSPFTESLFSSAIFLSLILMFVDLGIACMLELIGNRLLLSLDSRQNDEEERLQKIMPDIIRPPYAHIFPIHNPQGLGPNSEQSQEQSPMIPMKNLPLLAAQLYYWSPFTALPSGLYHCWQNAATFFLVASINESCRMHGYMTISSFCLAVAAYLEPHHAVMLIPNSLILRRNDDTGSRLKINVVVYGAMFTLWLMGLHGLSCTLVTTTSNPDYAYYWNSVLGTIYGNAWLTNSPNLSLQWYFHMQLFARFRAYFGAIFTGIPFVLVGPLAIRFRNYPGVLLATFSFIWTIYRPVQTLYDANLAFCFSLFSPRSLARMEVPAFVSLSCLLVPVLLNVVDHWMWLDANNGNANYMFFQCLAYNVFLGIILGQFTSASLQRDKALRIITREGLVVFANTKLKSE